MEVEALIFGIYIRMGIEYLAALVLLDLILIIGLGLYWDGSFNHGDEK